MIDVHTFERDGKRYRFVVDEIHETCGSYGYATPEETKAAEDEEIRNLESGAWIVVGCIVSERCDHEAHCETCAGWNDVDSLWGIVIENDVKALESYALESM